MALYKEGYEVGQTVYRRKVDYIFISRVVLLYLSRSQSMRPLGPCVEVSPFVSCRYLVCILSLLL